MAMKDENTKVEKTAAEGTEGNGGLERRSFLTAAAATAVSVGASTEAEAQQSAKKKKPDFTTTAAGYSYVYQDYSGNYTDKWFVQNILDTADQLRGKFPNKINLEWGHYQKAFRGADKDSGWGNASPKAAKFLFRNWESAVHHARKDLAKQPAPAVGPDPDNPGRRAANMLAHLDESIRYAIYDKKMPNKTELGIKFDVKVDVQPVNNRRHELKVYWSYSGMASPHNVDTLVIRMICPLGGWLGFATLESPVKVTKLISKFKVPEAPINHGQVVFIFNGLESVPDQNNPPRYTPGILQPVLQWTKAEGWTVRSWYVPVSYTPTPEQLPSAGCEKLPGQQPNSMCATVGFPADQADYSANPYVTQAVSVAKDDLLESHVEWDSASNAYKCWFMHTPATGGPPVQRALLTVPGLPDMTYAAAVIEGYMLHNTFPSNNIPLDGLPSPVRMDDVEVEYQSTPNPIPDWELGSDDPVGTPVKYGTNRLKMYRVRAPANKKLVFTHKNPDS
jgi:hypothetical protein